MSVTHHDWVRERIALAKRLNEGECGGYYGDAMLILSTLLSGLAADLWPGKGMDRRRFVHLHGLAGTSDNVVQAKFVIAVTEASLARDVTQGTSCDDGEPSETPTLPPLSLGGGVPADRLPLRPYDALPLIEARKDRGRRSEAEPTAARRSTERSDPCQQTGDPGRSRFLDAFGLIHRGVTAPSGPSVSIRGKSTSSILDAVASMCSSASHE